MSKLSLGIGSIVYYRGVKFKIVKFIDVKSVLVESQDDNHKLIAPILELLGGPPSLSINSRHDIFGISDDVWEIAKNRLEIIKPLLEIAESRSEKQVEDRALEFNIHKTTLYRWIQKYEASNILSSLIPYHLLKGAPGKLRIREEVELIVSKTIEDLYLGVQKLTVRKVYTAIVQRCKNARLIPPHENTVRARIKLLADKRVMAAREGKGIADRKYRNTDGVFPEGVCPLDVIQIDHTPMDIMVVDEKYRQSIGRPYLTLAIDVFSRMIAGFYISLEEPSYFSVAQCLSCSILPKDALLRSLNISGYWNLWGVPRSIHMDNASEFRGKELQRVCDQYGITIAWRPVARPQFGGHIERLIGTFMREMHVLPGTTFANIVQRGEYKPEKEAAMTIVELETYVVEFIVNVYHKRMHTGINDVPEHRYEAGLFGNDTTPGRGLPDKIENEDKFRISLLPTIERTIQRSGVKVDKIAYYSDALRRWIKVKENNRARLFIFKRDPRDISVIWFFDPELKEYFPIPYRNVTYPPISMWDLRMAQRYLEEKNLPDIDEDSIFKAYAKMQQISDEAIKKTKVTRKFEESKKNMMRHKKRETVSNPSNDKKVITIKESSLDEMFDGVEAFEEVEII